MTTSDARTPRALAQDASKAEVSAGVQEATVTLVLAMTVSNPTHAMTICVGLCDRVSEDVAEAAWLGELVPAPEGVGLLDSVALAVMLWVGLVLSVGAPLPDGLALPEPEPLTEELGGKVREGVRVPVTVAAPDSVAVPEREAVGAALLVADPLRVAAVVGEPDVLRVCEAVGVRCPERVEVADGVPDALRVPDRLAVGRWVPLRVPLWLGLRVTDPDAPALRACDGETPWLPLMLPLGVAEPVGLCALLALRVPDRVTEGVREVLGDPLPLRVEVGV